MAWLRRASIGAALASVLTRGAFAQGTDSTMSKTFFRPREAAIAGLFLAGSVGLSVFDTRIAHFFEDTSLAHVREGQRLDKIFTHINETTLTAGGLIVWGVARLAHSPTVADIAFHTAESVAAASLTAQVIRGPLGRSRPGETNSNNQYDFHFMKGFTNFKYRAFPSIHSSSGFAAASALVAETNRRNPSAVKIVAPIAYALALTPGLARMYLGQHWASDIFAGAFLGTFYGWRVVDYSHAHPTTRIDRIFLGSVKHAQIDVQRGSLMVGWSAAF